MEDIKRKALNYVNRQGKWDTFGTKVNGHLRLAPTLWNKWYIDYRKSRQVTQHRYRE
jgi:hypothetical protein